MRCPSSGLALLFATLEVAMLAQAHFSYSPRVRRGLHESIVHHKRDVAPFPSDLVRNQCNVDPDWLQNPWYFEPKTSQKMVCNFVMNKHIQKSECTTNSRVINNVFAAFVPYTLDDKVAKNEGGVYGDCFGFDCGPPAEVLREAPNDNFACAWWMDGGKVRYPLIPPKLPGYTAILAPIACPSTNGCYSQNYYEPGGKLAQLANVKMETCEIWFPVKDKSHKETWCHGANLGCETPTYAQLVRGETGCDTSKCKEHPGLTSSAWKFDNCDYNPVYDGCSVKKTGWGNSDSVACSGGGGGGGGNKLEKRGSTLSTKCAAVPKLSGAPASIASYVQGTPDTKEKVLAMFPFTGCKSAGSFGTSGGPDIGTISGQGTTVAGGPGGGTGTGQGNGLAGGSTLHKGTKPVSTENGMVKDNSPDGYKNADRNKGEDEDEDAKPSKIASTDDCVKDRSSDHCKNNKA